jgi:hypothetical protein
MIGDLRRSDMIVVVLLRLLYRIFLQQLDMILMMGRTTSPRTSSC